MFFFFKQKTAYEMRISDWSSDVCSSDLDAGDRQRAEHHRPIGDRDRFPQIAVIAHVLFVVHRMDDRTSPEEQQCLEEGVREQVEHRGAIGARSEEHTSELQSLMRISYAVFCLKKKNKQKHNPKERS